MLFVSSLAVGWISYQWYQYQHTPIVHQPINYTLTPGTSFTALVHDLKRRNIIFNMYFVTSLARLQGIAKYIKAGEYEFYPGMTARELMQVLTTGQVVRHKVTLIEGWTFKEVLNELNANSKLQHQLTGLSFGAIMQRLGYPGQYPEGMFFPDTYFFITSSSDVEILQRAYATMQRVLQQEWITRAAGLPYSSPYEALILASLIEKETAVPSERPIVADILLKRIDQRMRLQVDPTVIYGLGDFYKGALTRQDLKFDSPYNTYLHKGLPPTPIAMPSASAIEAALHPAQTDYWYFVAKGDGSHAFSTTLREHINAIHQYRHKN
ncbi:MAG: endolytic transglycosylase MltG [Gammaproteobacteria bacterium]